MDNNTSDYCGKEVEFLRSMIPIYHPKWPHAEKVNKQSELYNLFWHSNECIDDYEYIFLSFRRDIEWNGVHYDMIKLRTMFILGLGGKFTTLHNNMIDLPVSW